MSKFILVVESGCDFPRELAEKYHVHIVPMHVAFGDVERDDGAFPVREMFQYYEEHGELPKSSGANAEDFGKVFDEIHREHPEAHILHLAYSAATTVSYQCALMAAGKRDYVTSLDTKQVSGGQTLVVLHTARYLEEHPDCTLEEICAKVQEFSEMTHMGFFPGDLKYLKAGGRVSNVAYLGAKILSLNPLIEIQDGILRATKKMRGSMKKVAQTLLREFTEKHQLSRDILAFVYAPGLAPDIKLMMNKIAHEMGFREVIWVQTGCVVSVHSGPGGFGICGVTP